MPDTAITRTGEATPAEVRGDGGFRHVDEDALAIASVDVLTNGSDRFGSRGRCRGQRSGRPVPGRGVPGLRLGTLLNAPRGGGRTGECGTGPSRLPRSAAFQPDFGLLGWRMGQAIVKKVPEANVRGRPRKLGERAGGRIHAPWHNGLVRAVCGPRHPRQLFRPGSPLHRCP